MITEVHQISERTHSAARTNASAAGATAVAEETVVGKPVSHRYMLWIDGVGTWQVCLGSSFILGAPSFEDPVADVSLMANISRRHATLTNDRDCWSLEAHGESHVCGEAVSERTVLTSGDEIRLGRSVRLGFRIPSVLSTSAVLDFESEHRPTHTVDGVVLLSDHCLLGSRRDHHIRCSRWNETVVLFARENKLLCRSKAKMEINGNPVSDAQELSDGDLVSGTDFRFRVEKVP